MKLESFTSKTWSRGHDGFEDVLHPDGTKGGVFGVPAPPEKPFLMELPQGERLLHVDGPMAPPAPPEMQVRFEHCGRQYVFELSRREWLSVALGRLPPTQTECRFCGEDIVLPLSSEDGSSVLLEVVQHAWRRLVVVVKMFWWRQLLRSFVGAGLGVALLWVASPSPTVRATFGVAFIFGCVVHFERLARWSILGVALGMAGSALAAVWWQFEPLWGGLVGGAVGLLAGVLAFAAHHLWLRRLARREAIMDVLSSR